jgi:3-deoxy-D-manno-octulosonic-acid transferase
MDLPADRTGQRPDGPLIWVHDPPPAERAAAAELMRQMLAERSDLSVLLTGKQGLSDWTHAIEALPLVHLDRVPEESQRSAADFLDRWRPTLALFFPPNMPKLAIRLADERGTGLFLIVSDVPAEWRIRWRAGVSGTRRLLSRFDHIFAQSLDGASQLRAIGLSTLQITPCGLLSEGSAALRCSEREREALAALLAGRPIWLAACPRPGEDDMVVAAHASVLRQAHRLLLVLVPDDVARGPALAARLRAEGWSVALRSDDEEPESETQIYVADTEDELGLWLRLAPVCFMGGTLVPGAGPDPYCAAALGSAILHGPETAPHRRHYRRLSLAEASRIVRGEKSLAEALADILAPDTAATMARAAWDVSTEGTIATERVAHRLLKALDRAEAG